MAYVYILRSLKDGKLYTGSTVDLMSRLKDHSLGRTRSTRYRRPLELVYYEEFESLGEARIREKQLKGPTIGKTKMTLIESFPTDKLQRFSRTR